MKRWVLCVLGAILLVDLLLCVARVHGQSDAVFATTAADGVASTHDIAAWSDWANPSTGLVCWVTFAQPLTGGSNQFHDASRSNLVVWQTNSAATPAWTSRASGSVRFDGTDYLRLGSNTGNFGTGDFTVVAVVFCTSTTAGSFAAGHISNGTGTGWCFNQQRFGIQSNGAFLFTAPGTMPTNNWQLMVGGRSGTGVFFGANGGAFATVFTNAVWNLNNSSEHVIGGRLAAGNTPDFLFTGTIGDYRLYNRAWTQAEATNFFDAIRGNYGI